MSISISLCMIVKNEEKNLEACLSSAKGIVDEINIVDTGSTDKTVEVAKRYTDRVFNFEWVNDFSKARNFSFSKATKDYIFWLDADDTITPLNKEKILKLKQTLNNDIKYVTMLYHYSHNENGEVSLISKRERLVKRSEGFFWVNAVHETINVSGEHLETDIFVTHNRSEAGMKESVQRNVKILEQSVKDGASDKRTLAYYIVCLHSLGRFDEAMEQIDRIMSLPEIDGITLSNMYIPTIAHEIYLKKGNEEAALKVLLDNERFMVDKSEFYCYLGTFYKNRGNTEKALSCFKKASKCKGTEIDGTPSRKMGEYYYFKPLIAIAYCYIELSQLDEALLYCDKALENEAAKETDRLSVYITKHELYIKKGDFETALRTLTDNEQLLSGAPAFHCHLWLKSAGNCFIKLKRYPEALEYFKKALSYMPDDEDTLSLVKKLERITELAEMRQPND